MRTSALSILALMALVACGGETSANDPADTSTSTMSPPPDCTPGTEGCMCNAGACDGGLACWSDICVMPSASPTMPTTDATTTTDAESTSTDATTTSDPTDATAETTSTDDGAEDPSTDTGEGTTTNELESCEQEGNNFCEDGELRTCTDGTWNVRSCIAECGLSGLGSPGCADFSTCECEGYLDQACGDNVTSYCNCRLFIWEDECTPALNDQIYAACYDEESSDHEYVTCFASYPTSTYEECETAWIACSNF